MLTRPCLTCSIALGLLTNTIMWFAAPDGLAASAVSYVPRALFSLYQRRHTHPRPRRMSHASMIVSGTRLLLNLFEAFHQRVQRSLGVTTSGAYDTQATENLATLPTFRAAKRDLSSSRRTRAGWTDTSVLTGTDWSSGTDATESTYAAEPAADGEVEGWRQRRQEVYRLENLYGPHDVAGSKSTRGFGEAF